MKFFDSIRLIEDITAMEVGIILPLLTFMYPVIMKNEKLTMIFHSKAYMIAAINWWEKQGFKAA